jgi:hypothetical protein
MKRSAAVTLAAIIALLGSAGVAFFAVSSFFGMLFAFRHGQAAGTLPLQEVAPAIGAMAVASLTDLGFAGWGFATCIGLLRLKPWSRISVLFIAGFMAVTIVCVTVGFMFFPFPSAPNSAHDLNFHLRIQLDSFFAVLLAIAVWWMVLFTRKSVVEQFSGVASAAIIPETTLTGEPPAVAEVTPQPQRPLAITILAWYYLASLPSMIPAILIYTHQQVEIPFFGTLLGNRGAAIYLVLSVSVLLAAGIALLKNQVWGYWVAFSNELFRLLNGATILLLPGSAERWMKIAASIRSRFPSEMARHLPDFSPILKVSFGGGIIFGLIVLAILWMCRKRFFEFAAMQAGSTPKAL